MTTAVQSEYRNLPLDSLIESSLNPRRTFDQTALNELAASIRSQGVLMPLLVRPVNPQTYEVVAGKRRGFKEDSIRLSSGRLRYSD